MRDAYCPGCGQPFGDHLAGCRVEEMQRQKIAMQNTTWMVSMIHPDFVESGSNYWSERGGSSPDQALGGYLADEDVMMRVNTHDISLAIFCVLDSRERAAGGREWRTHLYVIEDGKPRRFP